MHAGLQMTVDPPNSVIIIRLEMEMAVISRHLKEMEFTLIFWITAVRDAGNYPVQ
jgi:hypothetical protein